MKNVAILGAKGFIGKNTYDFLNNEEKYNVIAVTRDNLDLLDEREVEKFFERQNIDIVIHCANQGGTRKSQNTNIDVVKNNLKMFFNVERCIKNDMKMINFGSGAQYDKTRDLKRVREEEFDILIPKDDYGYSKYVMSKYIRNRSNKKGIVYNPIIFGMYGIGEDYTYRFISNAIIKNILKMPIEINQNVIFDYLFIDDYKRILKRILEEDWLEREFNVTPSESVELYQLAECINQIGMHKSDIVIKNNGLNYQYTGDISRLMNLLGGKFEFTPYQVAIEQMYKYYYDNKEFLDLDSVKKDLLMQYCSTKDGE